jgi:hypothetical protein
VKGNAFLKAALNTKKAMDKDGNLSNCNLTNYMPGTPNPNVFGTVPPPRDVTDFHKSILNVKSDAEHISPVDHSVFDKWQALDQLHQQNV